MRVPAPGSRRSLLPRPLLPLRPSPSPRPPAQSRPQNGQHAPSAQRAPAAVRIGRRFRALLRRHIIFACVLTPAIALRADTMLGYRWEVWFNDSFNYVADAVSFQLDPMRPSGYAVFLKILEPLHSYAVVTSLQHLMGLAVGVMVYALARHRFGAPAWVASLAAVPVLYDAFQIQLEHLIMADVPFEFLITLAATIVLWDKRPPLKAYAIAGLLLGISDTFRAVGLPLLAVLAVYMIIQRAGWRRVTTAILACALPVIAYMGIFDIEHGQFALTDSTGAFLYQRVMAFASCTKMHNLPTDELPLCVTTPVSRRPAASQQYLWANYSPLNRYLQPKFSPLPNKLAENFAIRAIEAQPLGYAKIVWHDTWWVFRWQRHVFPNPATYDEYLFSDHPLGVPSWAKASIGPYQSYAAAYDQGSPYTRVVQPFARLMVGYQRYVYLPGTIYGVILLIGLGGMALAWRRAGGEALLPWGFSVVLIVMPAATAEFDYRYVLPAVPFACLAAAMAFGAGTPARTWLARRRSRAPAAGALAGQRDFASSAGNPGLWMIRNCNNAGR